MVLRTAPHALAPVVVMVFFKHSEISPLNNKIRTDFDFMSSYFSDRPASATQNLESTNNPETISNFPQQSIHLPSPAKKKENLILHRRRLDLPM